jgi:hypothetical protein
MGKTFNASEGSQISSMFAGRAEGKHYPQISLAIYGEHCGGVDLVISQAESLVCFS